MTTNDEGLDDFSKKVSGELFRRYPGWSAYASVNQASNGSSCCLELRVPCPQGSAARFLRVSTCDAEVLVSFDDPRTEFAGLGTEEAMALIDDLVAARSSIAVITAGDTWLHSEIVAAGETVELTEGQAVRIFGWAAPGDSGVL